MNTPPSLQFDLDSIREIAQLLRESELGEICLETVGDDAPPTRLCLRRAAAPLAMTAVSVSPLPVAEQSTPPVAESEAIAAGPKTTDVNSVSVGVFRAAKVPVNVGDMVKARQVLGNVESLRVPNEITAPIAGRILEISTSEGQGVEYGQTLFVIEES
jgi:biotin carboxyl carrier protein